MSGPGGDKSVNLSSFAASFLKGIATDNNIATTSNSSTPSQRQSPVLSQTQSQHSSPKSWSVESSTTRRVRHNSFEREKSRKKRSDGNASINMHSDYSISSFSTTTSDGNAAAASTASLRDDWWEQVLPPGQLAERLRKAQGSSSLNVEDEPRSSRKSILRNATPSERKIWTSLADFGQGKLHSNRSDNNSLRSSVGSLPSLKSDVSSISATSSSAEDNNIEGFSPSIKDDSSFQWDRTLTASPTSTLSVHRSTSLRRSRVVADSNDSGNAGLGLGGTKTPDVDERMRKWNFSTTPAISTTSSNGNHLRPFPSTTGGRQSPLHILEDTPEVSSEEEQHSKQSSAANSTKTTRTTRRTSRTTNSIRNLDNYFDNRPPLDSRQIAPISSIRRQSWTNSLQNPTDRHVSFLGGEEEQWLNQTIGRAAGRHQSMFNDSSHKRRSWQPEPSRRGTKIFHSSASDALKMHSAPHHIHIQDRRRTTCYSAPTSPRPTLQRLHSDRPFATSAKPLQRRQVKVNSIASDTYEPHLALYSSGLGLAQTRMASAGNIALTLTRQLSVPLRPMLQLTMFLSISSFTFMALACFLIAGYLVTVFDDVNSRGKQIHNNLSIVTKKLEAGLHWCERLLTGEDSTSSSPSTHHYRSSSSIVTAPIRLAFAVPTTIAYQLTPTSISESLGFSDNAAAKTASMSSSQQRPSLSGHSQQSKSIPPRPSLSSLLPSIFLTIVIALGAGLASFFANQRGASPSSASSPSATTSPLSSAIPPHASSQIHSIRKRNSTPSHPRRHSYDVTSM